MRPTDGAIDWVRGALQHAGIDPPLSPEQIRCFRVLCSWSAPYNLPLINDGWAGAINAFDSHDLGGDPFVADDGPPVRAPLNVTSSCVIARIHHELATFDAAHLTRLVVSAHVHAVRVSLSAEIYRATDRESYVSVWNPLAGEYVETDDHPTYSMPCLTIMLHPRDPKAEVLTRRHPTVADLAHYATEHAS